jgi:hypothetical protein
MHTHPSPRRDARARQLVEAFWVADALLLTLAVFFAIVGGAVLKSTAFVIAMGACAALLLLHGIERNRRHGEENLSADARRIRERRGF